MGLDIDNLTVAYGRNFVVQDATIAGLAPGTLTVLVGPNAAGKSSLLKAVAGLKPASSGRVHLDEVPLHAMRLRRRSGFVRYVPQNFAATARLAVIDALLVARMVAAGRKPRPADIDAAQRALALVGISHLAERETCALSGGQQQLVALAMGLVRPAPIILLDEPTSALDLRHQLVVLDVARSVARNMGQIVVVALHDLNLAARHADRVVLLDNGRIVADGPPLDVLPSRQCGDTFGVNLCVGTTPRGSVVLEAYL